MFDSRETRNMVVTSDFETCTSEVQRVLRQRLCGKEIPPVFMGYESEKRELEELIKRTATCGESNSILVIGPHGSGKTMLLKKILTELDEIDEVRVNLIQVHLNGLLQTDDKLALKEITRQLQLENSVGDKVFGSFAENLKFLLEALKSGGKQSKSILFILDEFDLFAHHKNQTLLYNLFDVAQSAQAPVCVVGLTTRLDVMELLEKRVKSRFSHRQLHLLANPSFEDYLNLFLSYLRLPETIACPKTYVKEWNAKVDKLKTEPAIIDILKKQYSLNKDIRALQMLMMLPVCKISPDQLYLEAKHFVDSYIMHHSDSKSNMLHGLSVLELCLIIAMKHLMDAYCGEPFTFEMVYNDYQLFCQKKSAIQMFDKAVVMKAFEHLCKLELVRPVDGTTGRTQIEYQPMTLLVDGTQVIEALHKYPNCPTEVKQWATLSVVG